VGGQAGSVLDDPSCDLTGCGKDVDGDPREAYRELPDRQDCEDDEGGDQESQLDIPQPSSQRGN
jgi:hypothetical protein